MLHCLGETMNNCASAEKGVYIYTLKPSPTFAFPHCQHKQLTPISIPQQVTLIQYLKVPIKINKVIMPEIITMDYFFLKLDINNFFCKYNAISN